MSKKRIVKLLTKPYCGLCEEVEFQLNKLKMKDEFEIIKYNVELQENKEYLKKYYYDIPVVLVDELEFKSRIDFKELAKIFSK